MDTTSMDTEALLDAEVVKVTKQGWAVVSRVPGTVVVKAPPIKLPIVAFLFLTLITFGLFLLVWIPLAWLPKKATMVLTVEAGAVVRKRSFGYN